MLIIFSSVQAESPFIYTVSVNQPLNIVYKKVYESLEESRYYVIFEANMGKNLARNAERWGEDYNRNKLEDIRSMVFCNPWYANQVSNLDPEMLAFCPLSMTMIHKEGATTILFPRITTMAKSSPAEDLLWEVESEIITIIESVVSSVSGN